MAEPIIDAWIQHPTGAFLHDPKKSMRTSLLRRTQRLVDAVASGVTRACCPVLRLSNTSSGHPRSALVVSASSR